MIAGMMVSSALLAQKQCFYFKECNKTIIIKFKIFQGPFSSYMWCQDARFELLAFCHSFFAGFQALTEYISSCHV